MALSFLKPTSVNVELVELGERDDFHMEEVFNLLLEVEIRESAVETLSETTVPSELNPSSGKQKRFRGLQQVEAFNELCATPDLFWSEPTQVPQTSGIGSKNFTFFRKLFSRR